ncbi:MAG TPA: hypothetical protein ENK11_00655 [Phycisphaerales bacterium]|nr:hypothetical protein [Phycisphaerales bacterium]
MTSPTKHAARVCLGAVLLAATASGPAGCNVVGPLYALAAGPGEVKAAYKLDPDKKTVIFVDDPANRIAQRRIRARIGAVAQDMLVRKNIIHEGNMIDTRSALAAASQENDGRPIAVTEVGRAVGADVVIYVLVTKFSLSPDGVEFKPASEVEVKVFDAANQKRLWPPPGEPGYRTSFTDKQGNRTMRRTRTDLLRAQADLAQLTGYGLAQLFYDVERPQSLRR